MKLFLIGFIICTIIYSYGQKIPVCKKQKTGNVLIIDLNKAYQARDNYPLSTVAESLEYLPLSTSPDCLLGEYIKRIVVTTDRIFIFEFGKGVYRFSKNGNFINKIGRIGKGPGECLKPVDMVLDTIKHHVIFLDHDKLVRYDYKGNHIQTLTLKVKSNSMIHINENILLLNNMYYLYDKPKERFSMFFYSYKQTKELSKIACEKKDKIPFSICDPVMYTYNNESYTKDYWGDTIYKVIDPFTIKSYAAINIGKFKHRDNNDRSIITGEENPGDTWVVDITRIAETGSFIILTSNKGLFIYNKKSKETRCLNYRRENEQWLTFNNDLTAGPDLTSPLNIHPTGANTFVSYHYAHNFFNENGTLKTGLPSSLKKLKPGDNPVLVFIKFKV